MTILKWSFNHLFHVIELKRNQSSDDTFGQLTRYLGWVKRHLKDENVKGIIIAGKYDKKLDYALEYAPNDTDVLSIMCLLLLMSLKNKVASFIYSFLYKLSNKSSLQFARNRENSLLL